MIRIRPAADSDWAGIWPFLQPVLAAGETYTYPTSLPLGTVVTVAEGDLPTGVGITWNDGESRVFETADGVTLSADNREATFTLSDDRVYSLTLTNTVAPAPTRGLPQA